MSDEVKTMRVKTILCSINGTSSESRFSKGFVVPMAGTLNILDRHREAIIEELRAIEIPDTSTKRPKLKLVKP